MTPSSEERRGLTLEHAGVELRAAGGGVRRFVGTAIPFESRTAIGDPYTWGFYEEVAAGSCTDTLAEDDQRFLVDHSRYHVVSRVSASSLLLAQSARGLGVDSALDERLSYVSDLAVNVETGNITGMSFAFYALDEQWTVEQEIVDGRPVDVDVRRLLTLRVPEVSAVTFPAYADSVAGLRAEDPVHAVGTALRSRPDAAELFERRSQHCPALERYHQREQITVQRSEPEAPAPALRARGRDLEPRDGWYRIETREESEGSRSAEVLIYDRIGFWGVEPEAFVRELAGLDVEHVVVRINSPGGDVYAGIAILNALRQHPARVTTVVDGLAASAASVIAMAGERVEVCRNAEMMVHEAWGLAIGDAAEMRAFAERLDRIGDNIASIYADRAGGTAESWRQVMLDEAWFSADEAVDAGLADAVREPPASTGDDETDEDEPGNERATFDLHEFRYAGRAAAPPPRVRRDTRPGSPDPTALHRARRMQSLAARFGG